MKRIFLFFMAIILLAVFCACSPAEKDNAEDSGEPEISDVVETAAETPAEATKDPIPDNIEHVNILLMGSMEKDFSKDGETYCLTHILITLDSESRTVKFTTFPYNLAVSSDNKIVQLQEVCSSKGEEKTVEVLNNNFGIDIDYWVVMNMNAVMEIVDAVKGIEIDITSLSINDMARHMKDILGIVWEEISDTGLQTLSGAQTAVYFVDTMPLTEDWMSEEEGYFREHHSGIIKGVINSVKLLELDKDDLLSIALNVKSNYSTNIPEDDWDRIASTAVYCLINEPEFLHVPMTIKTAETDAGWQSIGFDEDADVSAVQDFVN